MKTHDENGLPSQYNKACSPKEGGKFTTIWRFSIRPDLANNLTDSGTIADEIQRKFPGGVDKLLEMIGTVTLEDSLHCSQAGWNRLHDGHGWQSMVIRPVCADGCNPDWCLSHGVGGSADFMRTPLNELARQIEADTLHIQAGKICSLDDIA